MLPWPAESIGEEVAPLLPGFTVEVLPEVDSTNSELMRRARAGRLDPVLLVAEVQTAGRGRLGRRWDSGTAVGEVLTFSLGWPLAGADWTGLSLAVGVSVAQSLHPAIRLKWPNDLWWQERKLAGILIETTQWGDVRYAVVGVGINIRAPRGGGAWATAPAGLQELVPELDAPAALARVAPALVRDLQRFAREGWTAFQSAFALRDALAGRTVRISDGTVGQAAGVDGRGALLVHTAQGMRTVHSAEVSVRPSH